MGFYRNANTAKTVRAAALADEIWDLYSKAKRNFINDIGHHSSIDSYPVIEVGRERGSTSLMYRLKTLGCMSVRVLQCSFTLLKRQLLPPEATEEECGRLIENIMTHQDDHVFCNKAVIRWYLENLYVVRIREKDINNNEYTFMLDKNGEVSKVHTQLIVTGK